MSPFKLQFADQTLIDMARAVSLHARPDAPEKVTTREFDQARGPAGYPECPRARYLTERWNFPWRDLLERLHDPARNFRRSLGARAGDHTRKAITIGQCVLAAQIVARARGLDALDRSIYRDIRNELVAADERANIHGGQAARTLPDVTQIGILLRDTGRQWEDLFRLAGLKMEASGGRPGLSLTDGMAMFIDDTGHLPRSVKQYKQWGKARGVSLSTPGPSERTHLDRAIETIMAERNAAGLPRPAPMPAGTTFTPSAITSADAPVRRHKVWDAASVKEGLARAHDYLNPGERLTQQTLKRIARDHPGEGIPSYSPAKRAAEAAGSTFSDWRDEAARIWQRNRSAASP